MKQLKVNYAMKKYPGKETIEEGIQLLGKPIEMKSPANIFKYVDEYLDDYLDLSDDFRPIRTFFNGKQKEHWDNALQKVKIFEDSKTFIINPELEEIVSSMKNVLNKPIKENFIKDLPGYTERFVEIYSELLQCYTEPVLQAIEDARNRVEDELQGTDLVDKLLPRYRQAFQNLVDKAESSVDVAKLNTVALEADTLKVRFLAEISKEKEIEIVNTVTGGANKKTKTSKHVSIKAINPATTWQVETKEDHRQNRYRGNRCKNRPRAFYPSLLG